MQQVTKGENMNRIALGVAVIVLALGGVLFYEHSHVSADDLPSCVAGENEICPTAKWTNALKKYRELGTALNAGVPGGYSPNADGTKFIKNVTVVQPAPPVQPPKK